MQSEPSARASADLSQPCTRLTRRSLLAGAAAGGVLLGMPAPARAAATGEVTQEIIDRVNAERRARGVPDLRVDHRLSVVADDWSVTVSQRGQLAHNPNRTAEYGWESSGIAEVVVVTSRGRELMSSAARAVEVWMGSAPHRNILMSARYTHIGVGWAVGPDGRFYATGNLLTTDLPAVGQEAVGLSRALVADGMARRVVLVRDDLPADGLAAAGLLEGDVPLLLTQADRPLSPAVAAEIGRALTPGGTVHLVGGGLSGEVEGQVRQLGGQPVRLRGSGRHETAAIVAREVARLRGQPWRYLLVRDDGWADAAAAGAFAARHGTPILLTGRHGLHRAARDVLSENPDADRTVVGGVSALSDAVAEQSGAWRVSGRDRAETAARVMLDMWGDNATAGSGLIVTPGYTGDGWGIALAHASLAARDGHPLLLAGPGMSPGVGDAIRQAGFGLSRPAHLRFARHVSQRARDEFTAVAT